MKKANKLVKVKAHRKQMYGPGTRICFSLARGTEKNKEQVTTWFTCRDWINDVLIANKNNTDHNSYHAYGVDPNPDYNKIQLLIAVSTSLNTRLLSGLRIINIYEELAGFKKRSHLEKVKIAPRTGTVTTWLLIGPKEWMKCSQLTSMVTFILRVATKLDNNFDGKTIDDLDAFWKTNVGKPKRDNYGYIDWDISSTAKFYKKWRVLMENYNYIFRRLGDKTLYPRLKVRGWHSPGGICSLSEFKSQIPTLDKRFKKACENAGADVK